MVGLSSTITLNSGKANPTERKEFMLCRHKSLDV